MPPSLRARLALAVFAPLAAILLFAGGASARPGSGPAAAGAPLAAPTVYVCSSFQDVAPTNPNHAAIDCVTCQTALAAYECGYDAGENCVGPANLPYFRPAAALLRGQLARLVVIAAGWPLDTSGGLTFTDVPINHPFYAYVATAYLHGVISGYADNTFRPDTAVTRGQFARIVYLALSGVRARPNVPLDFSDVQPADYFYTPVMYLTSHGIMSGYPDNSFRPFNNISREDAASAGAIAFLLNCQLPPPPPPGGTISGAIYDDSTPANLVEGATVYACMTGGHCTYALATGPNGHYSFSDLPAGQYDVWANPPAGSVVAGAKIGPLTLLSGGTLPDQDVILHAPVPPPVGTTLEPRLYTTADGIPVVPRTAPLTLEAPGCPGGTARYQILEHGAVVRGPLSLTEGPSGSYAASVAPFYDPGPPVNSIHGLVQFVITIDCSGGGTTTITFEVYIDPSGHVRTTDGDPIPGATVTLYRADSPAGPLALVPDGSGLLSPMNRLNPDTTDAGGHFGWDVVTGYYQVRAERAGCHAPGNPAQLYVESAGLPIPPPVTDLDLRLECPGVVFTDVPPAQPFYRYVDWMGKWGYIGGYGCGGPGEPCDAARHAYFRPANSATRGQFAKMLGNALLWSATISPTQQTFADVPANQPFWLFVERVAAHGAISGYGCGGLGEPCDAARRPYFRPGANITRSQLAKILAGALPLVAVIPPTQQTFADVPAGHPFWRGVEQAAGRGLISGYGCGGPGEPCDAARRPYFRPYGTATRGQISKMIARALAQP